MSIRRSRIAPTVFAIIGCTAAPAIAGSHLWRFRELFSNADGTVQFIEMQECCGGDAEQGLKGLCVTSESTGKMFTFPRDLDWPTTFKHLLLATADFAARPGAPTPDFIIPDGFFDPTGDLLRYSVYFKAERPFGPGVVPTDGLHSATFDLTTGVATTGVNSPTNFLGETGSVIVDCIDEDGDGYGSPGFAECPNGAAEDCDDSDFDVHPNATEVCTDGVDNDCNGQTDCADAACTGGGACIPTLSEWGLVANVLVIGCAGAWVVNRRRASA